MKFARRRFLQSLVGMAVLAALPVKWVARRLGYVNVKWFGTKRDGVTDDIDAIQRAIDSANEHGGTVYFPPGEYRHKP